MKEKSMKNGFVMNFDCNFVCFVVLKMFTGFCILLQFLIIWNKLIVYKMIEMKKSRRLVDLCFV